MWAFGTILTHKQAIHQDCLFYESLLPELSLNLFDLSNALIHALNLLFYILFGFVKNGHLLPILSRVFKAQS